MSKCFIALLVLKFSLLCWQQSISGQLEKTENATSHRQEVTAKAEQKRTIVDDGVVISLRNNSRTNKTCSTGIVTEVNGTLNSVKTRRRRWEYEEEEGLDEDYSYNYEEEEKREESTFEKFAKNWQKVLLKFIFLFCFVTMICCCCLSCCLKICGKMVRSTKMMIQNWFDAVRCRDSQYRVIRSFMEPFGIKLTYEQYLEMKKHAEAELC